MSDLRPRLLQIINEFLWVGEEPCYFTEGDAGPMLDRIEDLLAKEGYVCLQAGQPGAPLHLYSGLTVDQVIEALSQAGNAAQKARADRATEKPQAPPLPNVGT